MSALFQRCRVLSAKFPIKKFSPETPLLNPDQRREVGYEPGSNC